MTVVPGDAMQLYSGVCPRAKPCGKVGPGTLEGFIHNMAGDHSSGQDVAARYPM